MNSTLHVLSIDELIIRKDNLMKQIIRIDQEINSRFNKDKKQNIEQKENQDKKVVEIIKPINSTINTMKQVLNEHKIQYSNNINKDELCNIVRKNCLIRECENIEKSRKIKKI